MNYKLLGGSAAVALLVSLGVASLQSVPVPPINEQGIVDKVIAGLKFGVQPGPNFEGKVVLNGAGIFADAVRFNQASSTLCSWRPDGATSTVVLLKAFATFTTGSSSAALFEWGRSANFDATTTSLGKASLLAGTLGTIQASTTADALISASLVGGNIDDTSVVTPGQYVNLKYGGACTGGQTCLAFDGYCTYVGVKAGLN